MEKKKKKETKEDDNKKKKKSYHLCSNSTHSDGKIDGCVTSLSVDFASSFVLSLVVALV